MALCGPAAQCVYVRFSRRCEAAGGARAWMVFVTVRERTYPRILRISGGSSLQAIPRSLPPQSGQLSISMANSRLRRCQFVGDCPQ